MVAKKMPPKKMAAPKKTGTADSSKLTPAQKAALVKSAKNRTDTAGRSGMGESAKSNMLFKGGSSLSAANKTAAASASKGGRVVDKAKYIESLVGAADYARSKNKKKK